MIKSVMNDIVATLHSSIDQLSVVRYVDIEVGNVRWLKLTSDHLGLVKGTQRQTNITKLVFELIRCEKELGLASFPP